MHWLGQKHLVAGGVFPPPLLLFWIPQFISHAHLGDSDRFGHQCLPPTWFQGTQEILWPCPLLLSLKLLSTCVAWQSQTEVWKKRWGQSRQTMRVSFYCFFFFFSLSCFLHWNLSWLPWTLTWGVKTEPDILCLLWSADIITTKS